MILRILEDAEAQPEVFFWTGSIPEERLNSWLHSRGITVPDDLKELWIRTGGGDVFEFETILGPYGDTALGDDVDGVNGFHRAKGMPPKYLVFHVGTGGLSALRLFDGKYVQLDPQNYEELNHYSSLEDWYSQAIRKMYKGEYDLPN